MPHASWKGHLHLSLVSVPVQAFNVESTSRGDVSFNQLHERCKSRIKYVKTCPIHGEVSNREIVKGYEYAENEYIIVDDAELAAIRGESEPGVNIDKFVAPEAIDPRYFEGRTYYLVPDGPIAHKPYAVLLEVLGSKNLWGVANANILKRDHLVVLRADEGVLCLDQLHYASDLRRASEVINGLDLPKVGKEEARLASMLVDASVAKKFDIAKYKDAYNDQVRDLLEAKLEGREIVKTPKAEPVAVINLMDALKKSLANSPRSKSADRIARDSLSRAGKARKKTRPKSAS